MLKEVKGISFGNENSKEADSISQEDGNDLSMRELQEAYRQRMSQQIQDLSSYLADISDSECREQSLLNLMQILSCMASTADTFNMTRLGERSNLMNSLVKEWITNKESPNEKKILLFAEQLEELANEAGVDLDNSHGTKRKYLTKDSPETSQDHFTTDYDTETSVALPEEHMNCYQQMVSASNDLLAIIDLDYRYVVANQTYSNQFNLTPNLIIGKSVEEVVGTSAFKHLLKPRIDQALSGEAVRFETWITIYGSESAFMDVIYVPYLDGDKQIRGMIVAARNITQRKIAEDKLSESEFRFRQLAENIPQVFYLKDASLQHMLYVSPAYERIWNQDTDTLYQNPQSFMEHVHPEDQQTIIDAFTKQRRGEPCVLEYRLMQQDGSERYIRSQSFPAYDENGEFSMIAGIAEDITDKHIMDEKLLESEQRYRALTELSPCGIFRTNFYGECIYANNKTAEIIGIPLHEVLSHGIFHTLCEEHREMVVNKWYHSLTEETLFSAEFCLSHPSGNLVWVKCLAEPVTDNHYFHTGFIGTMTDITQLKLAEQRNLQATSVFENTIEGIIITDARARIIAVNPAFEKITGYSESDVIGKNPNILHSGRQLPDFYHDMWTRLRNSGSWQGEIWNRKKDGEIYPEWLTISVIRDVDGNIINYIGVFSDITEIKKAQGELAFISYHDSLTDLPNRQLFYEHMKHAITRAERTDQSIGLIIIDLDRFKDINESLGHNIGDQLLTQVASRLSESLRGNDTISRIGGDEFTVLIEDLGSCKHVSTIAQKILDDFVTPFPVNGQDLYISASIGISIYPEDGLKPDILLKNADAAMYRAKEHGRNGYEFYTPSMTEVAMEKISMESKIHQAIENNEFTLYYQPQYELKTARLVGAEALLRWHSPEQGEIPPSKFIPIIEELPTIQKLGDMVIEMACQQASKWQSKGYNLDRISINIAGRQIQQKSFAHKVAAFMDTYGIDGNMLEFEITEGFIMRQAMKEVELLNQLRSMGITLAIDDFGTGYSSLSYLKLLPVDSLKIDQSFIRDIGEDSDDEAIARAIIALGHSMGLKVIAEGVETQKQCEFLHTEKCDQMQGYYMSHPLPAKEFEKLLESSVAS